MAGGVERADPLIACDQCPVADGGEGTLEALVGALRGSIHRATVAGPTGEPLEGRFGTLGDGKTGVVELAEASGISLIPPQCRDPTRTTAFGTGQLIAAAADRGSETVIVGLGGSGTVDGGAGIAQALGGRFTDRAGRLIEEPLTGGTLGHVAAYEPPLRLPRLRVCCDVTNPLCGPRGAAAVYGPQKGATPRQVRQLEAALAHLASLVGGDPRLPGSGAAGGAGFGLVALCGGKLERGIDLVLGAVDFAGRLEGADLVLSGEGCLDEQSLSGKACLGVARAAHERGIPTIAVVGRTGPGAERCLDPSRGGVLAAVFSLTERFGLERAMAEPARLIAEVAEEIVKIQESGVRSQGSADS